MQSSAATEIELFEQAFGRLQPRLFAYCRKWVDDEEAARDIVQECFLGLWNHRAHVAPPYDSYLFRSVHNRCMSHFKAKRVRTGYELSCRERIAEHSLHPETPYPLTELYMKEIEELMRLCIDKLPEKRREIFVMSRYRNMTNGEIARQLGVSVRTVETQLYNALGALRRELKDYLPLIMLLYPGLLR